MKRTSPLNIALLVGCGFFSYVEFRLAGSRMTVMEALSLIVVPFTLYRIIAQGMFQNVLPVFLAYGIWYIGVVISNYYNSMPFEFWLRGLGKVTFILSLTLFFIAFLNNLRVGLVWIMLGFALGSIYAFIFGTAVDLENISDYGEFVFRIQPIIITWGSFFGALLARSMPLLSAILLAGSGIIIALFGARSGALICLLTSLFYLLLGINKEIIFKLGNISFVRGVVLAVVILGLGQVMTKLYVFSAEKGWMGETAASKFALQSRSKYGASMVGLLAGGRADSIAALYAALERPLVGRGAWFDSRLYIISVLDDFGFELSSGEAAALATGEYGFGAGHSILFGNWATDGLAGLAFWLFVMWRAFSSTFRSIRARHIVAFALVPMLVSFTWDLFFSPLGPSGRVLAALFIAVSCLPRSLWERSNRIALLTRSGVYQDGDEFDASVMRPLAP